MKQVPVIQVHTLVDNHNKMDLTKNTERHKSIRKAIDIDKYMYMNN